MANGPLQNMGAAQPIGDWVNKYVVNPVRTVGNVINKVPLPQNSQRQKMDQDYASQYRANQQKQVAASAPKAAKSAPKAKVPSKPVRVSAPKKVAPKTRKKM